MSGSREGSSLADRILLSPVTWLITALNLGVFIIVWMRDQSDGFSLSTETLIAFGASKRYYVQGGEYWRLLTAVFLHGGLVHLAVNTWFMFGWCSAVEKNSGSGWFAFAYLTTGIGSFAVSVLGKQTSSVGASGAGFGIIAVVMVLLYRRAGNWEAFTSDPFVRNTLYLSVIWILAGFFLIRRIDTGAHLGGAVFGVLCGLVLDQRRGRRRPAWIAALAAYMVLWAGVVVAACIPGLGLNR